MALVVPFGDAEESFMARFPPDTGLLRMRECMRFKGEDVWFNVDLGDDLRP